MGGLEAGPPPNSPFEVGSSSLRPRSREPEPPVVGVALSLPLRDGVPESFGWNIRWMKFVDRWPPTWDSIRGLDDDEDDRPLFWLAAGSGAGVDLGEVGVSTAAAAGESVLEEGGMAGSVSAGSTSPAVSSGTPMALRVRRGRGSRVEE